MIRTGKQYIEGLRAPREVYVGGERVVDVTTYPAFHEPIQSYARLYDMKHDSQYQDILTYTEEPGGERYDISYLVPKSKEELKAKGRAYHTYARASYGCLGRGPEFMAALIAGMWESTDWFEQWGEGGAQKVADYVRYVRDNDLFLTHALGNPQSDRSKPSHQQANPYIHLRVKEETPEGLIIRGAKQLATAAPVTDEILVFPNGRQFGPGDDAYALCFAVPTTTPGVKIICREPLVPESRNVYDHPLSSRFEEMDALIVFDDVLVPWDRVFFYNSLTAANNMRFMTGVAAFSGHLSVHRATVRAALTVATAMKLCNSVKTDVFPNVGELLGRLAALYKAQEALLFRCEEEPRVSETGTYWVNGDALSASGLLFPDFYTTMLDVIKRTGAAGLMLTPTLGEFTGEVADLANTYFAGADDMPGVDRVQIAKLAWDLAGDSVGQRLSHYERFYIGEPMFVASFFARSADMGLGRELLENILAEGRALRDAALESRPGS
ncbi:4-hydroxyphenylacetate 3-monooxygenase, oxygenase component [Acrocarpospora macrocephala]|uniref:4-hydroxyphenylacetate 3-monooxygenase oxygenase component n=1 Tax=Acrocarpospora macrocephala TaxID=150177 RepID=A0A5M3WR27_9ACTN|nr:4-hydroxyphenylacetate 3-hydroxylase N-terminal domain-containing protein [Acrocarpospora macrocephala]GES11817.1 4-hydroxyphenylacetate 3-monooxygenase oxygenase component [Acrocarpospora macrocephala]